MQGSELLCLKNVGVTYASGTIALRDVSLCLRRGEFAVLLGSSGAGKSTLLRTVNHLCPPTQGAIIVSGLDALSQPRSLRQHRKQTGMIFQAHQLIARQSALQNVLMGRLAYHSFWRSLLPLPDPDQRIALRCLARVGLLDKALAPVRSLSGGQQQRVGIARALAQQPRLLLADEPIASLDPASAHSVLSLLKSICRADGITVLLSLHQVEFAKAYSDRIVGLADGRIVFDGPPTALTRQVLNDIYSA